MSLEFFRWGFIEKFCHIVNKFHASQIVIVTRKEFLLSYVRVSDENIIVTSRAVITNSRGIKKYEKKKKIDKIDNDHS